MTDDVSSAEYRAPTGEGGAGPVVLVGLSRAAYRDYLADNIASQTTEELIQMANAATEALADPRAHLEDADILNEMLRAELDRRIAGYRANDRGRR